MQSRNYSDNIHLAVYSMAGPEKCFGKSEDAPETTGTWKGTYENESSCSYSISVESEEPKTKKERSKSLSQLDPDILAVGEMARLRERLLRPNSHVEKSHLRNFSGTQRLTLILIALVDFMGFCSMSIMAPFFPKEAYEKGLNETVIGLIFSFYALIMFLTSPIFGKILPKVGTKCLFLSGILVVAVTNILFGFLEHVDDFYLFISLSFIIRGIEALGACAYSTASYVYVVNSFPQSIGSVLGILETFVGLGMSTGPAIGGFLYSLGGFPLPFMVLGITMAVTVPINLLFLPSVEECSMSNKSTSFFKLIIIKEVLIISLVVVFASSTWAFLDPTLEPHLRQFNLTAGQVGLIFLLFSALYAIASPIWGWCADKVDNHWSMMVVGLFMTTIGLLILGPCPYIPWLASANSLGLVIAALCILGVSIALILLPTFRGILTSATDAGHIESLATYSVVAGIWSCVHSLGEVIGPSLGGVLLQYYGFPFMSTVMAGITLTIGLITLTYFTTKSIIGSGTSTNSDSGITESWRSNSDEESSETTSLLFSRTDHKDYRTYAEDKISNYEKSRRIDQKSGAIDQNQWTDVRGTISITGGGACEV